MAEKFFNTVVSRRKLAIDDFLHDVKDINLRWLQRCLCGTKV